MRLNFYKLLIILWCFLFIILLFKSGTITGNFIIDKFSINNSILLNLNPIIYLLLIFISILFVIKLDSLESKLDNLDWKTHAKENCWQLHKYDPRMAIKDFDIGYLRRSKKDKKQTPIQKQIAKSISGSEILETNNNKYEKNSYEQLFYTSHASKSGRVFDVNSHTDKNGKLKHYNNLEDGWYIWVIDNDGNFVIGSRSRKKKHRYIIDVYGYKLAHPTLTAGKSVYGAGELFMERGKIKHFNSGTGHFYDRTNIKSFNEQTEDVFLYFSKRAHWKQVSGGATYNKNYDDKEDITNY
ncbi:hypothetical protein HOC99_02995 [Candidatus Woesearchaeota archaeon]|mgnify:CR=1 FL=1|nr:hypothetical protein [Candidatus Woesearchaeota archaeon]MBT7849240.1 hypothetical protein [Candidatus Woesearchaeota archaeon]